MERLSSSFRDDAGTLFTHEGVLYRAITQRGRADYELLVSSGLYATLASEEKLVGHEIVTNVSVEGAFKIVKPRRIPFISYPYEWSFSQLKDAALLTLEIQAKALEKGMSLKDASFFNVQFQGGRPIFIDTLSFEQRKDTPWIAYRQFCQHFLGPLVLMARRNPTCNRDLIAHIDGFPLDYIARLLPIQARLKPGVLLHLIMHAGSQKKYEKTDKSQKPSQKSLLSFGLTRQLSVIESLRSLVEDLHLPRHTTQWGDYVSQTDHYSSEAELFKKKFVEEKINAINPHLMWDFGGNIGNYSRLATSQKITTVCFDGDFLCVEKNYQISKEKNDAFMLPLLMDLGNPTPAIGWANKERQSLLQRGPADLVLSLALIHHLRITANIPLEDIISFMAASGKNLIIEFVPKDDPMAQKLLCSREDIFHDYTQETFENLFKKYFKLKMSQKIPGTHRTLYEGERL